MKDRFIKIAREIKREGIEKLLAWLETSDFYTAPASTKYHNSYEGGLLEHSLNVYDELVKEGFGGESAAACALFHDICKVNYYKKSLRNVKENGEWVQREFYEVDEALPFGYHGDKSVIILQNFIRLKTDEIFAIRAHMGGFDVANQMVSKIFEKCPLAVALHIADLKATYIIEDRRC